MLRTALQVSGVARALGNLRLQLEQKAENAAAQVKGVAVRVAVAAGFAIAAVMFAALALIVGFIALYAYLLPIYGVLPALGVVGGSILAIAALCALVAASTVRRKSAKMPAAQTLASEENYERPAYGRRRDDRPSYSSPESRAASEVTESLVSLAGVGGRSQRRGNGRNNGSRQDLAVDAVTLLQSGDRRTMMGVLAAVTAVGWLLGRTMPHSSKR